MKLIDVPAYNNCVFVHDQLNENLPESFSNFFKTAPKQHKNNTRGSRNNTIYLFIYLFRKDSLNKGKTCLSRLDVSKQNRRVLFSSLPVSANLTKLRLVTTTIPN